MRSFHPVLLLLSSAALSQAWDWFGREHDREAEEWFWSWMHHLCPHDHHGEWIEIWRGCPGFIEPPRPPPPPPPPPPHTTTKTSSSSTKLASTLSSKSSTSVSTSKTTSTSTSKSSTSSTSSKTSSTSTSKSSTGSTSSKTSSTSTSKPSTSSASWKTTSTSPTSSKISSTSTSKSSTSSTSSKTSSTSTSKSSTSSTSSKTTSTTPASSKTSSTSTSQSSTSPTSTKTTSTSPTSSSSKTSTSSTSSKTSSTSPTSSKTTSTSTPTSPSTSKPTSTSTSKSSTSSTRVSTFTTLKTQSSATRASSTSPSSRVSSTSSSLSRSITSGSSTTSTATITSGSHSGSISNGSYVVLPTAGYTSYVPFRYNTTINVATSASTPAPTATAYPMRIGPWDGTNHTLESIQSGMSKKALYGHNNNDSSYLLSVVTWNSTAGSNLISLPDFVDPYISSVSCKENGIAITFTNVAAYSIAATNWAVKDGLLTSGSDLCGNDTKTSFFQVTSIDLLAGLNTITLGISDTTAGTIFSSMDAIYGTLTEGGVSRTNSDLGNEIRNIWPQILDFFNNGGHLNKRDIGVSDSSSSTSWSLNSDAFSQFVEGFVAGEEGSFPLSIDEELLIKCPGCGVYADIVIGGGIHIEWFELFTDPGASYFYVFSDFNNFDVVLDFYVYVAPGFGYSKEVTLASWSPCGIYIEDVLNVGPTINLVGGFDVEVDLELEIESLGFNITMPDSGWQLSTSTGASSWGWDAQFTPLQPGFEVEDSSVHLDGYIGPLLLFGIQVGDSYDGFGWSAGLGINFPKLDVDFTQQHDGDPCYSTGNEYSYGIEFSLEMDIYATASGTDVPDDLGHVSLYDPIWPIYGPLCGGFSFGQYQ